MDNYEKYNLKYDNIESSLSSNDLNNQNDILSNLKDDLDDINQYKSLVNKSKALDFTQNFPQMFFEDNPNKNYVLFWTGEHPKTGQVFDPRLLEPMYLYDSITRIIIMKNTKR